ncbi:cardioacceleratory peptide receptor-like [Mytilus californianus]|uniref:cardioacceleratory peptide receptor-like n=1 Tax=Mytilus californianus TaxID=6549 RepID=UPI002247465B|nr:cardioacceleratory peptide receptor-like [Mytilus californianus]
MENTTTLLAPKQTSVWDNTSTNSSTIFFYQTEQVSFLIVLFILIVTGNCIVLTVLFLSGKIRSRMNLFMANLACADLMVGIFLVLTDVISKITITWETPDPGCKIVKFLQAMSTYASAFSLVALSIDRLSVVIRPLNRAGNGKSWTLIALAWIFAALFAFPMLLLFFVKEEQNMKFCKIEFSKQWMWQVYLSLNAAAVFIIPAVIIAFCYIVIVTVLWRKANFAMGNDTYSNGCSPQHIINKDGQTVPQQKEKKVRWNSSSRGVIPKAKIKTIKMTFVIVLAFIFCWSPYFVFDLLFVYQQIPDPTSQHITAINTFIQSLAPLNSAANPFIFLLFNFNTVKSACGRHTRHMYSPPTTQSHL